MNREIAEQIFAACENALAEFTKVEFAARHIEDEAERRSIMRALSVVIADTLGVIRAPTVLQYPDLVPAQEPGEPDDQIEDEDKQAVSRLLPADLEAIDQALVNECVASWRKVARVVGVAMRQFEDRFPDLPSALYAQRVAALVQAGVLDSQGNLSYMRFSEVKLPESARSAA